MALDRSSVMLAGRRGWWKRGLPFGLCLLGTTLAPVASACPPPTAPAAASAQPSSPAAFALKVPGDKAIEVVLGPPDSDRVIIYMHGVCGDPLAFRSWVAAASKHATFISLRGDVKCAKRPRRTRWSYDFAGLDRRIDAAIGVVDGFRAAARDSSSPVPLKRDDVVLIGYSQGAKRAETMAARYPKRYRRVVLIAIVDEPSVGKLHKQEAVMLIAGERDAKQHMRDGHAKLLKAGKRSHYLELPGAKHGQYGDQGLAVMTQALDWLFAPLPTAKKKS